MKEIIKSGTVLLTVTVIAGLCLGFVHELTLEPIEHQLQIALYESMGAVLPQAETYIEAEDFILTDTFFNLTRGKVNDDVVGYVVGVSSSGYSGIIDVLVGIDTDGVIQGISLLRHTETPGLGAKAALPEFTGQFAGGYGALRTTRSASPSQNEIMVITASTITTDAIVLAVNDALSFFEAYLR
ncbi:MAG: RnfABCDGE type electron transport complex subunit G [Defluviitaleaceae bacterium]|nr:RnfABCDGE type electron transport complex subunit G [Defluviitaleaceae bacterium]